MDSLPEKQRFEELLELLKSRQRQRHFRTKRRPFDLSDAVFHPFYFYCFTYRITITWPKCILGRLITATWWKINDDCGYLLENGCNHSNTSTQLFLYIRRILGCSFLDEFECRYSGLVWKFSGGTSNKMQQLAEPTFLPEMTDVRKDSSACRVQWVQLFTKLTSKRLKLDILYWNPSHITLPFIISRTALLPSIQPEAETLDFSTHELPRNF